MSIIALAIRMSATRALETEGASLRRAQTPSAASFFSLMAGLLS